MKVVPTPVEQIEAYDAATIILHWAAGQHLHKPRIHQMMRELADEMADRGNAVRASIGRSPKQW